MNSEDMVRLLRRVRHDYGNHLQVIMSYIDLGRYEMAKNYIVNVAEQAASERTLFEQAPADVALYLYDQMLAARDLGIILEYNEIRVDSVLSLQTNDQPCQTLKELNKKMTKPGEDEDYATVTLSIYQEDDYYRLVFNSKYLPNSPYEKQIQA
ncbi:MAG: Spo0B domain-containing protein [Deltaproteobacteria bacterium]